MGVARASLAPLRSKCRFAGLVQVGEKTRGVVSDPDLRSDGNCQDQFLAIPAILQLALTTAAVGGSEVSSVSVGEQGVDVGVGLQVDASTGSAVSTVRPTSGNVLLPASAYCAVSTITTFMLINTWSIIFSLYITVTVTRWIAWRSELA